MAEGSGASLTLSAGPAYERAHLLKLDSDAMTVQGTLVERTAKDPVYGHARYCAIALDPPIDVATGAFNSLLRSFKLVKLLYARPESMSTARLRLRYLGRRVQVTGTLVGAMTWHCYTEACIDVDSTRLTR